MKFPLVRRFQSKTSIAPAEPDLTEVDREAISAQFYMKNRRILEPLNHLIVAPKVSDYGDIQEYKKAFDITMQAITELKRICNQ